MAINPELIVNLAAYPIAQSEPLSVMEWVKQCQMTFQSEGIVILKDFINPRAFDAFLTEAKALAPYAFHNVLTGNAYLSKQDETLPLAHPINRTDTTALAAVAYDQIPRHSMIRALYEWFPLRDFIANIVGCGQIHHYSCPLGAVNIAVMKAGDHLRWHFDQSEFVVSIPLQDAEEGGLYEYVHNLRSAEQPNYEAVLAVLDGDTSSIQRLSATPGSLVVFQGKNTLHRVTEIKGKTERLVLLLGFSLNPHERSDDYLKQIRYGRTEALAI